MQEQHSQSGSQEQRAGRDRRDNSGRNNYSGPERRSSSTDRRRTRSADTTYFEWASHFLGRHELALSEYELNGDTPLLDSGAI